jgi:hypothetical protein
MVRTLRTFCGLYWLALQQQRQKPLDGLLRIVDTWARAEEHEVFLAAGHGEFDCGVVKGLSSGCVRSSVVVGDPLAYALDVIAVYPLIVSVEVFRNPVVVVFG